MGMTTENLVPTPLCPYNKYLYSQMWSFESNFPDAMTLISMLAQQNIEASNPFNIFLALEDQPTLIDQALRVIKAFAYLLYISHKFQLSFWE